MIVVDTSALLAILNKEPERDVFLDILAHADAVMVSAVTYYEAMLVAGIRRGPANADDFAELLATAEAQIVSFDVEEARAAFAAYRRYGKGVDPVASLNLCDCAAYALARRLAAPLLYKGQDFAATDIVAAVTRA